MGYVAESETRGGRAVAPAGASRPVEKTRGQSRAEAGEPPAEPAPAREVLADMPEAEPSDAGDLDGEFLARLAMTTEGKQLRGEQLHYLDQVQAETATRSANEAFIGHVAAAEQPDATTTGVQLGLATHEGLQPAPAAGGAVAVAPGAPAATGPSSPGPVTLPDGKKGAPVGSENGAVDHRARREYFYDGAAEASGEEPVVRDFDVEVAQGAALERRLSELGYASDPGEALDALRGLGYVGGDDDRGRFDDDSEDLYLGVRFGRQQRRLTPEQRQELIDALIRSCRRRPQERPRDMFYRWWGDNPFEVARVDPLSTFSVDVDTSSYTLARRYLAEGMLPEKAQIRTEEFVNYFKGDVPPPSEETFRVACELAPSLFGRSPDTWMLRVAIRGREVPREQRKPLALTFVVDVSGSMKEQSRLELVKHAMRLLVGELDARDSISIVAFTNDARLVLPMTSARQRGLIESAIHPLQPEGGTNVQAGLRMGYEAALAGLSSEANNRVVLLSDGVGNIGETDADALNREVARHRDSGIYLNTVGVGMNNHNDAFLEQLADKGDGICNYVDDEREARRALVENFTGAFEPIARDAKIQVEFDPAQVERYRLLGYENRAIADKDFRNDAVDAGEVGSGHQVVALYELVRTGRSDPEAPLATVRVRWKPPYQEMTSNSFVDVEASELAQPVYAADAAASYAATGAGYRRSVLVAQLAEFLRRSIHAREDSFEALLSESRKLAPELGDPDFDEFVEMVGRTIELISAEWGRYDGVARRLDALRMQNYLRAQLEDLRADLDRARLEEIDRQIQELEGEVRELLERGTLVR